MDENILRRIQKCLALSESPEPHEAAAALRQAQKLMELHGVDAKTLKRAELGEASVRSKVSVSKMKDWELLLLSKVGSAFGCKLMFAKSSSYARNPFGVYTLVGVKTQVELAQYTCEVLLRQLIKARSRFVANLHWELNRKQQTVEADTFCRGWVRGVTRAIIAFAHLEDTQQAIEDLYAERTGNREASPAQRRLGSHDALLAGTSAGREASIHRPVDKRADLLQIGG